MAAGPGPVQCCPPGNLQYPSDCYIASVSQAMAEFQCKTCGVITYGCEEHFGLLMSSGIALVNAVHKKNPHDLYYHLLKGDYTNFLPTVFKCPKCGGLTEAVKYPTWKNLCESFNKNKLPAAKAFTLVGDKVPAPPVLETQNAKTRSHKAAGKAAAAAPAVPPVSDAVEVPPRELTVREKRQLAEEQAAAARIQREYEEREARRAADEEKRRQEFQAEKEKADRDHEELKQKRKAEAALAKSKLEAERQKIDTDAQRRVLVAEEGALREQAAAQQRERDKKALETQAPWRVRDDTGASLPQDGGLSKLAKGGAQLRMREDPSPKAHEAAYPHPAPAPPIAAAVPSGQFSSQRSAAPAGGAAARTQLVVPPPPLKAPVATTAGRLAVESRSSAFQLDWAAPTPVLPSVPLDAELAELRLLQLQVQRQQEQQRVLALQREQAQQQVLRLRAAAGGAQTVRIGDSSPAGLLLRARGHLLAACFLLREAKADPRAPTVLGGLNTDTMPIHRVVDALSGQLSVSAAL